MVSTKIQFRRDYLTELSTSVTKNLFGEVKLRQLVIAATLVFVVACGVRLIYLQDKHNRPEGWDPLVPAGEIYVSEAQRIAERGFAPSDLSPRAYARHILHPPGYLLYLIGIYKIYGWENQPAVMAIQVVLDSITTVLIFLFAALVMNLRIGMIAGLLVAISPHLAYNALSVSPESLFALPVILAVLFLYLANRQNKLIYFLLAGICIGLSCWLRSNGLAMSPFFAVLAILFSKNRKFALKGGLLMILATACLIVPITVRNYIITKRFIPLSVGFGVIFMQAVSDYDFEKEYGLPKLDYEVALKEAEWYNRPDYANHFLRPDGIERDNARVGRTLEVIKKHPFYYLSTIFRRLDFMLRYDLPRGPDDWPFNTATPVFVSKYALYASGSPEQFGDVEGAEILPPHLLNSADRQLYSDEFPLKVEKMTDYVIKVEATVESGSANFRVLSENGDRELGAMKLDAPAEKDKVFYLSFGSEDLSSLKVKVDASPAASELPVIYVKDARLIKAGATPWSWTDPVRSTLRGLQRNLYKTNVMRVLLLAGLLILVIARRTQPLIWVTAVPLYFLLFQSLLHTEYRYILPMHYFLFILAAVALYSAWSLIMTLVRKLPIRKPAAIAE